MKRFLLFLILILSFGCVQQNDIRFTDSKISTNKEIRKLYKNKIGNVYLLIFKYDASVSYVPMTSPPGPAHYPSIVSVFKKDNTEHYKLIYTFDCQFTNGLCDEDYPPDLIAEATRLKFLQDKKQQQEWKDRIKKRNNDQIESTADVAADIVQALLD